jgi:hypothetical protein
MARVSRLERLLKPERSGASRLTEAETERFRAAWRERFAAKLDRALSAEIRGGFDWHTFSYGVFPHLSGDKARNAYRMRAGSMELVLLPHRGEGPGFRVSGPQDFSRADVDVYIFPESLAWTTVFTHEDDWLGPYFAEA